MRLPRRVPWSSLAELDQVCSWIYTDEYDLDAKVLAVNRVRENLFKIQNTFLIRISHLSFSFLRGEQSHRFRIHWTQHYLCCPQSFLTGLRKSRLQVLRRPRPAEARR